MIPAREHESASKICGLSIFHFEIDTQAKRVNAMSPCKQEKGGKRHCLRARAKKWKDARKERWGTGVKPREREFGRMGKEEIAYRSRSREMERLNTIEES